jgi:hypothetical protein
MMKFIEIFDLLVKKFDFTTRFLFKKMSYHKSCMKIKQLPYVSMQFIFACVKTFLLVPRFTFNFLREICLSCSISDWQFDARSVKRISKLLGHFTSAVSVHLAYSSSCSPPRAVVVFTGFVSFKAPPKFTSFFNLLIDKIVGL